MYIRQSFFFWNDLALWMLLTRILN